MQLRLLFLLLFFLLHLVQFIQSFQTTTQHFLSPCAKEFLLFTETQELGQSLLLLALQPLLFAFQLHPVLMVRTVLVAFQFTPNTLSAFIRVTRRRETRSIATSAIGTRIHFETVF
jgi:hypothetical protein